MANSLPKHRTVFVFKEPLAKTNIQQAELLSLIEIQCKDVIFELLDFDIALENCKAKKSNDDFLKYDDEIMPVTRRSRAHILFFEQSALVFYNFSLDVVEMIRRSGYIHSAGDFLFTSKWENLKIKDVSEILAEFCMTKGVHFPLTFYKITDNIEHKSLNHIIIDDKRYHIGTASFNYASSEIDETFEKKLAKENISAKGDGIIFIFKDSRNHIDHDSLKNFYPDRNVGEYAVCYRSQHKKDNPIHALDDLREAKPYWAGIFTTPHCLVNAMLNLAKVDKNDVVVDPFCHTGTTAIEASQFECEVICTDLAETVGAKDNYEFLCKGSKNFLEVTNGLYDIAKNRTDISNELRELAYESAELNTQGLPEVKDNKHIDKILNSLKDKPSDLNDFINRIYFYILRRFELERKREFYTSEKEAGDFVLKYLMHPSEKKFKDSPAGYYFYGKQLEAFETAYTNGSYGEQPIVSVEDNKELFLDSQYEVNRIGYVRRSKNDPKFSNKDIREEIDNYKIKEGSVDAVVSDPPYGYGEGLGKDNVEEIYSSFFEKSFTWLKSNGYIVFCALDKVKTGRKEGLLFTEDILKIANNVARQMEIEFTLSHLYPIKEYPFHAYYWKSKYALNRSIIVLKIVKRERI